MSRRLLTVFSAILLWIEAAALPQLSERCYLVTDRDIYLAGDRIWCSAFCIDAASGKPSDSSAIAYACIADEKEVRVTARIALFGGRGSGYIDIPADLPTGNYSITAYTALCRDEQGYDYSQGARCISIFNTSLTRKSNAELCDTPAWPHYGTSLDGYIGLSLKQSGKPGQKASLTLDSRLDCTASLSVSISRCSGLPRPERNEAAFSPAGGHSGTVLPEYEGEVIYALVEGPDREKVLSREEVTAYISAIGERDDLYTGHCLPDGRVAFRTSNIFGDKELVCEVDAEQGVDAHIRLCSPFAEFGLECPALQLSAQMEDALLELEPAPAASYAAVCDSLIRSWREDLPLMPEDMVVYNLDDYNRFATMKEVFVEILPEVRSKGRGENARIELLTLDGNGQNTGRWATSLVMIDGVPVFRHSRVMAFDAMNISRIEVWRHAYRYGDRIYYGLINLVSKEGGIAFVDFGSNVRIVDFKGCCYPVSIGGAFNREQNAPDRRELVLWLPVLTLEASGTFTTDYTLPSRPGLYELSVEGLAEDGTHIFERTLLEITEQ